MPENDTHHGPFRRIEIAGLEIAPPGESRIIRTEMIEAAQCRQQSLLRAEQTAADIIEHAHTEAESLLRSMQATYDAEFRARLSNIESDVSARLSLVNDHLGEAVAESVEAIYRSLFHTDPNLLLKATIEIAKQVLAHEIGRIVHVNTADQHDESLEILASRFELRPSGEVPNGTLIIESDDGEIKIDAKRLIDDLGHNLRQFFLTPEHTSSIQSKPP